MITEDDRVSCNMIRDVLDRSQSNTMNMMINGDEDDYIINIYLKRKRWKIYEQVVSSSFNLPGDLHQSDNYQFYCNGFRLVGAAVECHGR